LFYDRGVYIEGRKQTWRNQIIVAKEGELLTSESHKYAGTGEYVNSDTNSDILK